MQLKFRSFENTTYALCYSFSTSSSYKENDVSIKIEGNYYNPIKEQALNPKNIVVSPLCSERKPEPYRLKVKDTAKSKSSRPFIDFLIPEQPKQYKGRKVLVLDLDETLVHSSVQPISNPDITFSVFCNNS
jgi:hypothetical protein